MFVAEKKLIGSVAYVQFMLMKMGDKAQILDQTNKNLYKTKCLWCRYSDSTNSKLHNSIKICIRPADICSLLKKLIGSVAYVQLDEHGWQGLCYPVKSCTIESIHT